MTQLYNPATGYNRAAIIKLAVKILRDGMFANWKISARERWGRCLKTAWSEARNEKRVAEFEARQAELARIIAAHNARYESDEVIPAAPVAPMTAQEMIDRVYAMAGTLD